MFLALLAGIGKMIGTTTLSYIAGGFLAEKLTGKDNKNPLIYTDDISIGSEIFKGPFMFTPEESNNALGFLVYEHQYELALCKADVEEAQKVQTRIDTHQARSYKIQNVLRSAQKRARSVGLVP